MEFIWAIRFLNTYWHLTYQNKEYLEDPEFIEKFVSLLTGRNLETGTEALSISLPVFRGELYPIVQALQEGKFEEDEVLMLLDRYIGLSSGRRKIQVSRAGTDEETGGVVHSSSPRLVFEPDKVDEAYVLSELATMWHHLLFEKDRTRIKICELPGCECIFFDESKNYSKRHCAERCSNIMKTRRHREKKQSGL